MYRQILVKVKNGYEWVDSKDYVKPQVERKWHKQAITSARPWKSRAMAVHRTQAKKFDEDARRAGTGSYTPDGVYVATDRGQRRGEHKRRKMFDRDAGYGDVAM